MIEFDNIKIGNLLSVLNEDTTLSRYYPLIEMKEVVIKELLAAGIMDKYDFLNQYKDNIELTKAGLSADIRELLASFLTYQDFKERKLKELECINEKYITFLYDSHIKTSSQILLKFRCREDRLKASENLGIPYYEIYKITCLCDLMRLPGVKSIRAELYYNCNIKTIVDMAKQDMMEAKKCISKYIGDTNSKKSVPLNKELATQIAWAKVLPIIIEND